MDDEGHVHELFPELEAVAEHLVLAERLAVIARDDDRRSLAPRRFCDRLEHAANVEIGEGDLAVVELALRRAEVERLVRHVVGVRVGVVHPEEEAAAGVLGLADLGEHPVGDLVAVEAGVGFPLGAFGRGRVHVDDVEAAIEAGELSEVAVALDAHRPDPRVVEALGDRFVLGAEAVEVAPVAMRLARVLADQERPDALAGVGGERIRVIEHRRSRGEGIEVLREGVRVAGVAEVGAHRVDGDQDDVEVVGDLQGGGARCRRRRRRARRMRRGRDEVGALKGLAVAVFVDPVVGDFLWRAG